MATFGQKQAFESKLVGIVSVITGESKAKFVLLEEDKKFKNGTNTLTVSFDDLPDVPVLPRGDKSGKQYRIRMSSDGKEVEAIGPVNGLFEMELVDLGKRPEKDSDPMPYHVVRYKDTPKEYEYDEFFAVYQFASGMYKGMSAPAYKLHYKFMEDENNPGYAGFSFNLSNKKATRGIQLAEWGHRHGVWELHGTEVSGEPIAWDDETILPEILERALEHPRVQAIFKDGYIQDILPSEATPDFVEQDVDDELDEVDAAFPPAKPEPVAEVAPTTVAKKSPAKAPVKSVAGRNTPKRVKKESSDEEDL